MRRNLEGLNFLRTVARERYAWPGGYEMVAITNDGAVLCSGCLRNEYSIVYRSTRDTASDGWEVAGMGLVEELADTETMYCAHCGKQWDPNG